MLLVEDIYQDSQETKNYFLFAFYEPDINPRLYPMQSAHRHDYYLKLDVYAKTLTFSPHSLTRQKLARLTLAMIWRMGVPLPEKSTTTKRCTVLINTTKAGVFARRPCMLLHYIWGTNACTCVALIYMQARVDDGSCYPSAIRDKFGAETPLFCPKPFLYSCNQRRPFLYL